MTMFYRRRQLFCGYGGGYGEGFGVMSLLRGHVLSSSEGCAGSDLVIGQLMMAEDQSRADGNNNSSWKDGERDETWLQLGIGGGRSHQDLDNSRTSNDNTSSLVELELMPSPNHNGTTISHSQSAPTPRPNTSFAGGTAASLFLQQQRCSISNFSPRQEINWAFRPVIPTSIAASSYSLSSSPSTSSLMASGPYHPPAAPPGPGVDFRVIQAPRRPRSGIWFMLLALPHQQEEPFLPQISKSYLRIKDGTTTVGLVVKYLVNKLRLDNESEIVITCKGQRLQPFLKLQHVRDNIWSSPPRDFITLLPDSSTAHHIMVLHYARASPSN